MLGHYLDGGVKGRFPRVAKSSVPAVEGPVSRVRHHAGAVHPGGLYPAAESGVRVLCPMHFRPGDYVVRELSRGEFTRLCQVPAPYHAWVSRFLVSAATPYVVAPSSEAFAAVFCQLWGVRGGDGSGEGETSLSRARSTAEGSGTSPGKEGTGA